MILSIYQDNVVRQAIVIEIRTLKEFPTFSDQSSVFKSSLQNLFIKLSAIKLINTEFDDGLYMTTDFRQVLPSLFFCRVNVES